MVFQNWDDYLEGFGSNVSRFTQQISEQLTKKTCELHAKYPRTLGINPINRGILNNICQQFNPPIAIPIGSPFIGGQCEGEFYRVEGYYANANTTMGACNELKQWFFQPAFGAILGIEDSASNFQLRHGSGGIISNVLAIPSGNPIRAVNTCPEGTGAPTPAGIRGSMQITRIIQINDLPDDCGNPPDPRPPDPPLEASDFFTEITLQVFDSSGLPTPDFEVIGVDIEINVSADFGLSFDVNGINIDIGGNGISIGDEGGGGGAAPGEPTFPETIFAPESGEYNIVEAPESQTGEEEIGTNVAYITLDLVVIPPDAKVQFGDGAPDIYYAGWFEFKTNDFNYVRQPIHFLKNIFVPPRGATGYAYTLRRGYTGIAGQYSIPIGGT